MVTVCSYNFQSVLLISFTRPGNRDCSAVMGEMNLDSISKHQPENRIFFQKCNWCCSGKVFQLRGYAFSNQVSDYCLILVARTLLNINYTGLFCMQQLTTCATWFINDCLIILCILSLRPPFFFRAIPTMALSHKPKQAKTAIIYMQISSIIATNKWLICWKFDTFDGKN